MSPELIARVVERLRALADESRVRLLIRLKRGPCNVTALQQALGIAQASVSKHLAVLRAVGLVEVERIGTQAVYSVADHSVYEMCELVCSGVVRHAKRQQRALAGIAGDGTSSTPRAGARR